MPVYYLPDEPIFPPPYDAEPNGLLAVGGDLSSERLLAAYREGIFPWFSQGDPYLWWSPNPRLILTPDRLHISRSLRKTIRKGCFHTTIDCAFDAVIHQCAEVKRHHEAGTWITAEMREAYGALHRLGYAHSAECWVLEGDEAVLVGGMYGIALGSCFFGESMFHHRTDASKVAFVALVEQLKKRHIGLIDCQMKTDHLIRLGAWEIPREQFLQRLRQNLTIEPPPGSWRT
ncbi:MAG: leucyl/phenylalanyl-tRNA--protein transferase [Magnetococcales bacterium]|nr:leucyl/phenylalanyl-tRNA--protein transferase [Magnetococcales bacterium]